MSDHSLTLIILGTLISLLAAESLGAKALRAPSPFGLLAGMGRTPQAASPAIRSAHLFLQGRELEAKKSYTAASFMFGQCLQADGSYPAAWLAFGVNQARIGHPQEGENALRHALSLRPHYPEARFVLGQILQRQGDLARATEQLDILVGLTDGLAPALAGRLGLLPPPIRPTVVPAHLMID